MVNNTLLYVGGAIALFLILKSTGASGSNDAPAGTVTSSGGGVGDLNYDFSGLDAQYGADNVAELQRLYDALLNAPQDLTAFQVQAMLAQALQETGLFTDNPNYNATDDRNNFGGIKANSNYPSTDGSAYAGYPTVNDFVSDWIRVLSFGADPLAATSISDYNTRLKTNGYYTDSSTTYGNNLATYFNLLGNYQI